MANGAYTAKISQSRMQRFSAALGIGKAPPTPAPTQVSPQKYQKRATRKPTSTLLGVPRVALHHRFTGLYSSAISVRLETNRSRAASTWSSRNYNIPHFQVGPTQRRAIKLVGIPNANNFESSLTFSPAAAVSRSGSASWSGPHWMRRYTLAFPMEVRRTLPLLYFFVAEQSQNTSYQGKEILRPSHRGMIWRQTLLALRTLHPSILHHSQAFTATLSPGCRYILAWP